jgi:hypothetical protein
VGFGESGGEGDGDCGEKDEWGPSGAAGGIHDP